MEGEKKERLSVHAPSYRLEDVTFSPVRTVLNRAKELEAEGRSVVHLEIGEPDYDTPSNIVDFTIKSLKEEKNTHYGPNAGLLSLRRALAKKLKEENGLIVDPETEILVTVGAAEVFLSPY